MRFVASLLLALGILCHFVTPAAADLKEVQARGELRHIGVPYANFITGAGDGFDAELVQGFAAQLGVRYTPVYSNFYTVVRDLLGKEVVRSNGEVSLTGNFPVRGDMISTGFTKLPWRESILLFSEPVFPSQVFLVTPAESPIRPIAGSKSLQRDIEETKELVGNRRLLVMDNTCLDPRGYGLANRGLNLRTYTRSTNINEMVPAMLAGEADMTLLDVANVILDLQQWAGRIKVIGPISEQQLMAAAFPKSSPDLRNAYNAYLAKIRADGTYNRLIDKYYPGIRVWFPDFFAAYAPGKR